MRYLIYIFLICLLCLANNAFARFELQIVNKSSSNIYVRVYPIGAIFNGEYEYSLSCKHSIPGKYNKIYGGDTILPVNGDIEFNHDYDYQTGGTNGAIGFGKYNVEFYEMGLLGSDTNFVFADSCISRLLRF